MHSFPANTLDTPGHGACKSSTQILATGSSFGCEMSPPSRNRDASFATMPNAS